MTIATLDDSAVLSAHVTIPRHGVWWADVEMADATALAGTVNLALADASYVGTIRTGGVVRGRARYRIAGGAGTWYIDIAARAYANDMGVRRTTIAQDAATACGESVDVTGLSGTVGPHYTRAAGSAASVLDYVAARDWYVGVDGVTYFGVRAAVDVTTDAPRVRVDPAAGILSLAPSEIVSLVPGATVDGYEAVDVVHDLSPDGLRTTLYASPIGHTRRREALRRLVHAICPEMRWAGVYECRVVAQTGDRLSLQPVLSSSGLPALPRVRVRPGVPGVSASHMLGSLVLMSFADRDPARPVVVAFDDVESPGHVPTDLLLQASGEITLEAGGDISLDASGDVDISAGAGQGVTIGDGLGVTVDLGVAPRLGVARQTDAVIVAGLAGTIVAGSLTVKAGL